MINPVFLGQLNCDAHIIEMERIQGEIGRIGAIELSLSYMNVERLSQ
jgi:hypothetical protein